MFIHEYQAKNLLKHYELPFPPGKAASNPEEAEHATRVVGGVFWVVKAQILAGNRGRYGGVKIARNESEVGKFATEMIGSQLVTSQTDQKGFLVEQVYVEQGISVGREMYLAMLVDRSVGEIVLLASSSGGADIEERLKQSADQVIRVPLRAATPPSEEDLKPVSELLGLAGKQASDLIGFCQNLHKAFMELDALLIEVNPLILTEAGELCGLDVKMELDDNATFRHEEYKPLSNYINDPDRKFRAQSGYNFVRLSGDIGLVVGGAGLALATMDIIKLYGGEPANFLDLPPVASRSNVVDACKILFEKSKLSCLLVNMVGGGLTRCDTVAEGLITLHRESPVPCPVVVRFEGTAKDHAVVLLRNAKFPFILAKNMRDAVERVIHLSKGG